MEITYFEHYARLNDLSPDGRKRVWPDYDRMFSDLLPTDPAARILDVGCGAGLLLEWLKQKSYSNAIGIDADRGQVDFAKRLGLTVEFVNDASEWLLKENGFQLIVMSDVLEHIPRPQVNVLLKSIYAALRPAGTLFARVPNANSSFAARARYIDTTHERSYTELSLTAELAAAGFHHISVSGEPYAVRRSLRGAGRILLLRAFRAWRRLEAIAELGVPGLAIPLSLNLIAVCRRDSL